ncbi:MAG TPA: hypothetical protein VFV50_03705 [Bdellovibrionales bacterium]|nr:hypothetical protein [Bdellovibrionales bacterium]
MAVAEFSSVISLSPQEVFQFLFLDGAWERGLPPEFNAERLEDGPFREGTVIRWRIGWKGFQYNWSVIVDAIRAPEYVEVRQQLGIFNSWALSQTLEDHGAGSTLLKDRVEYQMPLGLLGRLADDLIVRRETMRLLESRHEKIRELAERRKNGA